MSFPFAHFHHCCSIHCNLGLSSTEEPGTYYSSTFVSDVLIDFPRFYLSDKTFFDRWTDSIRNVLRAEEVVREGCKRVLLRPIKLSPVPGRILSNQVSE